MNIYIRSMMAGLVATIILSMIMLMKSMIGIMPDLNVIRMLGKMAHDMMGIGGPGIAWLIHFMIGTVLWGVLFAVLFGKLPGNNPTVKGIAFGILAWFLMMLIPMPMAGAGLFGLKMGLMAPIMTLMLHMIYGAVLGFAFGKLTPKPDSN